MLFGPGARAVRDARRDGRHGDHHRPDRPARRQAQRARTARGRTRADRSTELIATARTVGGRRSAVHPRRLRCARLLRVRCVRCSVVADGRRCVHRVGAAGVRLHGAGRVDRRPVIATGLRGRRGLVRDRRHRRVRHAPRLPALARPSSGGRPTRYCPTNEGRPNTWDGRAITDGWSTHRCRRPAPPRRRRLLRYRPRGRGQRRRARRQGGGGGAADGPADRAGR